MVWVKTMILWFSRQHIKWIFTHPRYGMTKVLTHPHIICIYIYRVEVYAWQLRQLFILVSAEIHKCPVDRNKGDTTITTTTRTTAVVIVILSMLSM